MQHLPRIWSETGANVQWDRCSFREDTEEVGYAVVVPVRRLTNNDY